MDPLTPEDAARSLYRYALESRDYALVALDPGGHVRWWSTGAQSLFGYSAGEMLGQPIGRIFTTEDLSAGADKHEREIAVRAGASEDDRWQVRRDGSRFFASGVLTALHGEDGALVGFMKTLRDRTDLREQVERLRNDLAEAREAAKRKDVFLGTLSHELRNPLAPMINAAALIRMAAQPSPELDHALQVIDRQAAVLKRLVDDLLDLTRLGTGKVLLDLEPQDISEMLTSVVRGMRPPTATHLAAVELLVPESLQVLADANRLQQVFANLLGNALKFTSAAGHVWVKATLEADEAVVRFEDDGVGIAAETLPSIFELFTQAEETRRMSAGGLGIGLSLVKDLVTLHGGTVQVRSEGVGQGSEFTVRLPLYRPGAAGQENLPGPAPR